MQVEPSGIEPDFCNRPFVGFGAVERQSRPQNFVVLKGVTKLLQKILSRGFSFAFREGFYLYTTNVVYTLHNVKRILQIFWRC